LDLARFRKMLSLAPARKLLFVKAMFFVEDVLKEVFLLNLCCFSYEELNFIYGLVMMLK